MCLEIPGVFSLCLTCARWAIEELWASSNCGPALTLLGWIFHSTGLDFCVCVYRLWTSDRAVKVPQFCSWDSEVSSMAARREQQIPDYEICGLNGYMQHWQRPIRIDEKLNPFQHSDMSLPRSVWNSHSLQAMREGAVDNRHPLNCSHSTSNPGSPSLEQVPDVHPVESSNQVLGGCAMLPTHSDGTVQLQTARRSRKESCLAECERPEENFSWEILISLGSVCKLSQTVGFRYIL